MPSPQQNSPRHTFFSEATDFLKAFNEGQKASREGYLKRKLIESEVIQRDQAARLMQQKLDEANAGSQLANKIEQGVTELGPSNPSPGATTEELGIGPTTTPGQATNRPFTSQELQQQLIPYAARGHPTAVNLLRLLQNQQQRQQQQETEQLMLELARQGQGRGGQQPGGQPTYYPSYTPRGLSIVPHFPPTERQPGPPASPELFAQQQELARLRASLAGQNKPERLAPKGTYVDKEGIMVPTPADATLDDVKGLIRLDHGSMQEKIFGSSNIVYNHIDQALNHLEGLAKGDHNRFIQFMNNSISNFRNDPDAIALFHFLGPANMVATSNVYASQSAGMRGSARLANLMRGMGLEKGDSLSTALKAKLSPLAELNLGNIKDGGLPSGKYQQQLARIQALIQEGSKSSGSVTLGGKTYRRQ